MVNSKNNIKNIKVIIGANYGDEGKGRTVDYFTRQENAKGNNVLVVCSNGGAQRGHTVVLENGFHHIFHHFGSGTLAGADTYLPESFIVNPMIFMKEYQEISSFAPTVYINPNCLVSTPFDMMNNQIIEESRGSKKHGSCGVGIWETILRDGIRYKELISMSDEQIETYLMQVRDKYSTKRFLRKNITMSDEWRRIYYNDNMIHNYIRDLRLMSGDLLGATKLANNNIMKYYDSIIFENGQGLLLDGESNKDDIYSTPSDTKLSAALKIIQSTFEFHEYDLEACYITRSYLTRHSIGEFREQQTISELGFIAPNYETNQYNIYQGEFRYGVLNIHDLIRRVTWDIKSFKSYKKPYLNLVITHMDEHELPTEEILSTDSIDRIYKIYGPQSDDKVIIEDRKMRNDTLYFKDDKDNMLCIDIV